MEEESTSMQVDTTPPLVGVIMGSQSDWEVMKQASQTLELLKVPHETRIVSAHRTPERLFNYAKTAQSRGLKVIIAGAGGAAHLPGMAASLTLLPVLGVPMQSKALSGMDSLLSIVQMPSGIPVGTLAIGAAGAVNAAILAASILSSSGSYPAIATALQTYRENQTSNVAESPNSESESNHPQSLSGSFSLTPAPVQIINTAVKSPLEKILNFPEKMVPPGGVIGIVGGGQLGKMMAVAAAQLGYKTHIYCPDKHSPAFQVAHDITMAEYSDYNSLSSFAQKVDVVTYEFENIPASTVEHLAKYAPVRPKLEILAVCQNRLSEKNFVNSLGIPTTKYESVTSAQELRNAVMKIGVPSILKTNTMGYDGKGQITIKEGDDPEVVWKKMLDMKADTAILEAFVDFEKEVSILVSRGFDGKKVTYPICENKHQNHILKETLVPAQISDSTRKQAEDAALKIAEGFNLIGLLAVEMFVTKEGKILVNEMAPRPHNSGHWTIEGCSTSQFEQVIRAICGLPQGSTKLRSSKIVMQNLLGDEIHGWEKLLQDDTAHLHIYGKPEARPGRKMGHVTRLLD